MKTIFCRAAFSFASFGYEKIHVKILDEVTYQISFSGQLGFRWFIREMSSLDLEPFLFHLFTPFLPSRPSFEYD